MQLFQLGLRCVPWGCGVSDSSVKIWLPWCPADYLRDTITLTLEEDAVYRRAIDFLWQNPDGIPKETRRLCLALRITTEEMDRTVWVLDRFLDFRDGFYSSDRVNRDREKAMRNRAAQRENGSKGGRPHKPVGSVPLKPIESPSTATSTSSSRSTENKSNPTPPGSSAKKWEHDGIEYRTASDFYNLFLKEWAPSAKAPDENRLQAWAKVVDAMIRLDGRTEDDIEEMCNAINLEKIPPERNGKKPFEWKKNILSIGTLREKWNEGKLEEILSAHRKRRT